MATATAPATPSPAFSGRNEEPLDTTVRLVTPERISFEYPLAGPFRRALAYMLDILIMVGLAGLAGILATVLSLGTPSGIGIWLVMIFGLIFFYGALCEAVFNGQTPGKKALGLRVVSDQGVPITGTQAMLRNLLWGIDGIFFGYIPAVACMIATRKFQRLGDLAAGTMVMVEQSTGRGGVVRLDEPEVAAVLPWLPVRVAAGPELARALSDYVKHRRRFPRGRREEMAGYLARPVRERYNLPDKVSADAIVCALYQRVFLGD